jgi:hypothetical protein
MAKSMRWTISLMALACGVLVSPALKAQTPPPKTVDGIKIDKWNSVPLHERAYVGVKSERAPRRDLSGIWDATGDRTNIPPPGIQPTGAFEHRAVLKGNENPPGGEPDERNIPNPLPYTPLGEAKMEANKPTGLGVRSVPSVQGNDPVIFCNPPGFPRMDLNEFRTIEILQAADHLVVLNQFFRTWRTIWTDGRALPDDAELRWNGYSVGKWMDDYTLVVETIGMRDDTWVDNQGRPHSTDLKVEERFHRVDNDHLELTVTIDDPKMYTKPWLALNKFPLKRQPRGFDIQELYCSPSDFADYNKDIGDPIAEPPSK